MAVLRSPSHEEAAALSTPSPPQPAAPLKPGAWPIGLLLLLSPLLLVIAIAVAISSRGPVFYASIRPGMGGTPFSCFPSTDISPVTACAMMS